MSSKQLLVQALFIGLGLTLCSIAAFCVLPNDVAPYTLMPGLFVGLFLAEIVAAAFLGNPHGLNEVLVAVIAAVVNFPCYVGLIYGVLRILRGRS
jgi:hypothetical protein